MISAPPIFLAVVGVTGSTAHRLPPSGRVIIGRAPDCDIVVDDVSVSRHHAEIDVGPPATICDLGSSNGTRVSRRTGAQETAELLELQVERGTKVPIAVGEAVCLGSVLAFLRSGDAPAGQLPEPDGAPGAAFVVLAPEMIKLRDLAVRVAKGPVAVLVYGETGVGKEVLARMLHDASPRAAGPFVAIHCGALPEGLAESELFGHEKGAFTGAVTAKPGLFEAADGGTVFLDEVAELSPGVQTKLLRIVEDKKVQRLGAVSPRTVDVRIVSATHRDLAALAKEGRFRQDLYFRLAGISLTVPPLRARKSEVGELARLFAARTAWAMGQKPPRLPREVVARLEACDWPGNVRELRNVVERAVVLAGGEPIDTSHLLLEAARASSEGPAVDRTLRKELEGVEKQRIVEALARCHGNQTKAAELLGMPRRTLVARLAQYGIERPRKR